MITNHDIEIAFVRAQARINEQIQNAQGRFILPDLVEMVNVLAEAGRRNSKPEMNDINPLANEEI